jgi:hypothetical protein
MISEADPIEAIPDPDAIRRMLADAIRQRELLCSLLRVSVRKANRAPQPPAAQNHSLAVTHAG